MGKAAGALGPLGALSHFFRGVPEGFGEKATSGLFWVPKSKPTVHLVNV